MGDIPEVEKMFLGGGKSKQKDTTTTAELIKMAKSRGIKTPTKY